MCKYKLYKLLVCAVVVAAVHWIYFKKAKTPQSQSSLSPCHQDNKYNTGVKLTDRTLTLMDREQYNREANRQLQGEEF